MSALLLLLLLQSEPIDPDWQIQEAIAEERLKAAKHLESMKAWKWARAEYRKIRRLDPSMEEARAKLEGAEAIPRDNEKQDAMAHELYYTLLSKVAGDAAARFTERAESFQKEGRLEDARRCWAWAILYDPTHEKAACALGYSGKDEEAVDPAWANFDFKRRIANASPSQKVDSASELEKRWGVRNSKRKARGLTLEGVDITDFRLTELSRVAQATIELMEVALNRQEIRFLQVGEGETRLRRLVLMKGQKTFLNYIDDLYVGEPEEKKALRTTAGFFNGDRREFVQFCWSDESNYLDLAVAHTTAEFMFPEIPADWIHEGTAILATQLLLGETGESCIVDRKGTDAAFGAHSKAKTPDAFLRDSVRSRRDEDVEFLAGLSVQTMTSRQLAKSVSLVKFLLLRHPNLYRAVAKAHKHNTPIPRAVLEPALGFTLEELDEFWRRWYLW